MYPSPAHLGWRVELGQRWCSSVGWCVRPSLLPSSFFWICLFNQDTSQLYTSLQDRENLALQSACTPALYIQETLCAKLRPILIAISTCQLHILHTNSDSTISGSYCMHLAALQHLFTSKHSMLEHAKHIHANVWCCTFTHGTNTCM